MILPRVMDLEHFMESFLARRSNQDPMLDEEDFLLLLLLLLLLVPEDKLENVLDLCNILISILALTND